MSFPVPECPSRNVRANEVARRERSPSQSRIPSSSIENATSGSAFAG
jgi:hypothetical protein